MQFDTIIFDLDGTLVDTADDLAAALNHVLAGMGRPEVAPASVRHLVGRGARALLERGLAASGGASAAELDSGLTGFLAYYAAHLAVHSRPFAGVEPALDRLAGQGFQMGICTNKPAAMARDLIDHLGWGGRFRALLGGDSLPFRKPDPRHLRETLARTGGRRMIFVGDSTVDAETAKNAAVPLVLLSHGYSTEPVAGLGADAVIGHFEELGAAVAGIQRRFNAAPAEARP